MYFLEPEAETPAETAAEVVAEVADPVAAATPAAGNPSVIVETPGGKHEQRPGRDGDHSSFSRFPE